MEDIKKIVPTYKYGKRSTMPTEGSIAEPRFAIDKGELFINDGNGNNLLLGSVNNLKFKKDFVFGNYYDQFDLVRYHDVVYIALNANQNVYPISPDDEANTNDNWSVFVEAAGITGAAVEDMIKLAIEYYDSIQTPKLEIAGGKMEGDIDLNDNELIDVRSISTNKIKSVRKELDSTMDLVIEGYKEIKLDKTRITTKHVPVNADDLSNKLYVDKQDEANRVRLTDLEDKMQYKPDHDTVIADIIRLIKAHDNDEESHEYILTLIANVAAGSHKPVVFKTEVDLINWISGGEAEGVEITVEELNLGQSIYIESNDDPDYWVSKLPVNSLSDLKEIHGEIDLSGFALKTEVRELRDTLTESIEEIEGRITDAYDKDHFNSELEALRTNLTQTQNKFQSDLTEVDERLSGEILDLGTKHDSEMSVVNTTIANNKTTTDSAINNLTTKTESDINALDQKLSTEIETLELRHDSEMSAVNTNITNNKSETDSTISSLTTKTETDINALDQKLSTEIDTLELKHESEVSSINTTIANNKSETDSAINNLRTKTESDINALDQKLSTEIDTINTTVTNNKSETDSAISSLDTKLSTEIDTLELKHDSEMSVVNTTITNNKTATDSAMSSLTTKTESDINNLRTELKGDVSDLETKHNNEVTDINASIELNASDITSLNLKVNQNKTNIETSLSEVETRLTGKISTENTILENKISDLEEKHDLEVGALDGKVDANLLNTGLRIDEVDERLSGEILDLESKHDLDKSNLNSTIISNKTELEGKISTLDSKVDQLVIDSSNGSGFAAEIERVETDVANTFEEFEGRLSENEIQFHSDLWTLRTDMETADSSLDTKIQGLRTDVSSLQSVKVDKVVGKQLSTNDYTTPEKTQVAKIEGLETKTTNLENSKVDKVTDINIVHGTDSSGSQYVYSISKNTENNSVVQRTETGTVKTANATSDDEAVNLEQFNTGMVGKVDKVAGKQLSTNDYTTPEKTQVAKIEGLETKTTNLENNKLNISEFNTFNTSNTNKINAVESGLQLQIDDLEYVKTITVNNTTNDLVIRYEDGREVNIPLSSAIKDGYFDDDTKEIVLVVVDDSEIRIPAEDLVAGLASVTYVDNATNNMEVTTNKISSITGVVNNTQYMGAKLVIDLLSNKVDKVTGKDLSSNDYTTDDKNKLAGIQAGAQVNPTPLTNAQIKTQYEANSNTNAYTDAEKTKLAGIETGAQVNPYSQTELDTKFNNKVDKVTGKGLSTNDFTNEKNQWVTDQLNLTGSIKVNIEDIVPGIIPSSLDIEDQDVLLGMFEAVMTNLGPDFERADKVTLKITGPKDESDDFGYDDYITISNTDDPLTDTTWKRFSMPSFGLVSHKVFAPMQAYNESEGYQNIWANVLPWDKVEKETGKSLSSNDYTNSDKTQVAKIAGLETNKVDKVTGKGLSTNDYTTVEKNKLAGLSNQVPASQTEVTTGSDNTKFVTPLTLKTAMANIEVEDKLDKITTTDTHDRAYVVNKLGNQIVTTLSTEGLADSIPLRNVNSQIEVGPGTADNHAVNISQLNTKREIIGDTTAYPGNRVYTRTSANIESSKEYHTLVSADTFVLRTEEGRIKAADGLANEDLVTMKQLSDLASDLGDQLDDIDVTTDITTYLATTVIPKVQTNEIELKDQNSEAKVVYNNTTRSIDFIFS